ncbi:MAG: SAM-dependent methyltransferase [Burkholderiaceae bacterium]
MPPSDLPESRADAREEFLCRFGAALEHGKFVDMVLSQPHRAVAADLHHVRVRLVALRGRDELSFVYRYATRDVTKNHGLDEGVALVAEALGPHLRHGHFRTQDEETSLRIGKRGQSKLLVRQRQQRQAGIPELARAHDREKHRWVSLDRPFLGALGVTDSQGLLIPAMARKYKQIDKFVQTFANALSNSTLAQARSVRIMDFGAGKGYLTFAIHDHLRHALGVDARVTGVELRHDMVALCNAAAARLGSEGLTFEQGDVTTYAARPIDVMIALHACDTATDHAIHLGVQAGAAIILCAPCCHKELRPQLLSPHPIRAILQHGVHLGQEAEMVTDGLRALLLEACGYATQVFEFVALEHTSKNKMILAVKRPHPEPPAVALRQVNEVKSFYGIAEQRLERLLAARLSAA